MAAHGNGVATHPDTLAPRSGRDRELLERYRARLLSELAEVNRELETLPSR